MDTVYVRDLQVLWVWIAAPLLLVAALILTVRLRVPQVSRLVEALRAMRSHDPGATGVVHPATSAVLGAVGAYGAAGAVGAATAVSLGGAGAVVWVWVFAIVLMPLRLAEAALARTAPPGRAGGRSGALAIRLLDDPRAIAQGLGWSLLVLVPVAGLAFYGGSHGEAVVDAAERLLPGSALALGLGVAAAGALLALLPQRAGSVLGWIGAVSILVLSGAGLVAFFSAPSRGLGSLGRGIMDALHDAPGAGAFAGATAAEIAFAAMLHVLPPAAATAGIDGALHAGAQAQTTKRQAAGAMWGPLLYALMTTVLGLSLVATGAFSRAVEGSRPVGELTAYRAGFETVSQRAEADRLFTGIVRVREGSTGAIETHLSTERGMVGGARFTDSGRPADVMLRYRDGRIIELQRYASGRLSRQPEPTLSEVVVHGRMLPRGGGLIAESMLRGGGSVLARVALSALLLLAAVGAAAWGLGVARTLRGRLPERASRGFAIVPALGLAIAALGVIPRFGAFGTGAAALLVIVTSIALVVLAKDASAVAR